MVGRFDRVARIPGSMVGRGTGKLLIADDARGEQPCAVPSSADEISRQPVRKEQIWRVAEGCGSRNVWWAAVLISISGRLRCDQLRTRHVVISHAAIDAA